jgi:hypothetical protein
MQEFSRTISEDEGRKFAERTGSLFIEVRQQLGLLPNIGGSISHRRVRKTAVNVKEAFIELVEKVNGSFPTWVAEADYLQILDNPSLYAPVGAQIRQSRRQTIGLCLVPSI